MARYINYLEILKNLKLEDPALMLSLKQVG